MDRTPTDAPRTPMSIYRALAAIEEWTRKGWRFFLEADGGRWICHAIGTGLAHADCGGETFEAAVELSLTRALAMEDDPQVVIGRYRPTLETDLRAAFGDDVKFDIEVEESSHGPWDGKKIVVYILCETDPKEFVDRECKFWEKGLHYPKEVFEPMRFSPRFPEEAAKKT